MTSRRGFQFIIVFCLGALLVVGASLNLFVSDPPDLETLKGIGEGIVEVPAFEEKIGDDDFDLDLQLPADAPPVIDFGRLSGYPLIEDYEMSIVFSSGSGSTASLEELKQAVSERHAGTIADVQKQIEAATEAGDSEKAATMTARLNWLIKVAAYAEVGGRGGFLADNIDFKELASSIQHTDNARFWHNLVARSGALSNNALAHEACSTLAAFLQMYKTQLSEEQAARLVEQFFSVDISEAEFREILGTQQMANWGMIPLYEAYLDVMTRNPEHSHGILSSLSFANPSTRAHAEEIQGLVTNAIEGTGSHYDINRVGNE